MSHNVDEDVLVSAATMEGLFIIDILLVFSYIRLSLHEVLFEIIRGGFATLKIQPKTFALIILIIFLSLGVSSCAKGKKVITDSLPNDNSWFTRAKRIAITYGTKDEVIGYLWSSKTLYFNLEKVYYSIGYVPSKYIKSSMPNMVRLTKTAGSLTRTLGYNEDTNLYVVIDSDLARTVAQETLTREKAEDLAHDFFKELDKYGLLTSN